MVLPLPVCLFSLSKRIKKEKKRGDREWRREGVKEGERKREGAGKRASETTALEHACMLSRVRLFATPWTVARQAPQSMRFPRQEYWSGLPFPPPDLPDPGIEPVSPASPALAGGFFTTESPGKPKGGLQFSSVAQPCPTLCDPMDCRTPVLLVNHQMPKFTQTHVH